MIDTPRIRTKICGITRVEDALAAAHYGADAIGLVFYAPSPRAVSLDSAQAIVAALPPFVNKVGLFVNASRETIEQTLKTVALDTLQFHGDETLEECSGYALPYIKALRMRPDIEITQALQAYPTAAGILLDSYQPGIPGGTGVTFDWTRVPSQSRQKLIIAGGLTPDNVATAIHHTRPYAVDVSGGVEHTKGIKDPAKVAAFIRSINHVTRF